MYDTSKLKPFDLKKALAGEKVCTADGREVGQLTKFLCDNAHPLRGVVSGRVSWTVRGEYLERFSGDNDLRMAPTERVVWVNLYEPGQEFESCGLACHYSTREDADAAATRSRIGGKAYPITIEE